MQRAQKTIVAASIGLAVALMTVSCASAPAPEPAAPEAAPDVDPPAVELGDAWSNAELEIEAPNSTHGMGAEMARAEFWCEWTDGESGGTVYPQRFVDVATGEEVAMDFMWDHGGNIPAGVYDVLVDADFPGPGEGWLRNVPLEGPRALRVTIDLNATKIEVPLGEIKQIVVYPAGTYADFASRNMLDAIPDDVELTRYDEYNRTCIAPSGEVDLRVTYYNDEVEWLEGYTLPPNSKVTEL